MESLNPTNSSRTHPLRIDTDWTENDASLSLSLPRGSAPASSRGRQVPSVRVSTSPISSNIPPPSPRRDATLKNASRGNESKKLLAHVLEQIKYRDMPPSAYDGLAATTESLNEKGFGSFIGRAVKRKNTAKDGKSAPNADNESEDEDEGIFSTDATFELMTRLRDLLTISASQGWQIFDDGYAFRFMKWRSILNSPCSVSQDSDMRRTSSGGRFSSPFRRSVNTLQPGGKRSRSPSPARGIQSNSTGLLSQCIRAISSVVAEDCRFRIASPRPSRPPFALQAVTLEVAQFLLHTHRHTSEVVSQVVFALIPAFSTFPKEMHVRLLAFFEECVTRNALEQLSLIQGAHDIPSVKSLQGKLCESLFAWSR